MQVDVYGAVAAGVGLHLLDQDLVGPAVDLEVDKVGVADAVEDVRELAGIERDRERVGMVAVDDRR